MECLNCNKKLSFANKPLFGLGRLKDGAEICHKCYKKFIKIDANLTTKLKNYTLNDLIKLADTTATKNNSFKPMKETTSFDDTILSKRERKALIDKLAIDEDVISIFRWKSYDLMGVLVFTDLRLIAISDGLFSLNGINIYYYNNINRILIKERVLKFTDLHGGYEGEKEKFEGILKSEFENCVNLLKEQIKRHKKFDRDSYPYLIKDYEEKKINKEQFIKNLKDY